MISFHVDGLPVTQGSMVAVRKGIIRHSTKGNARNLPSWRQAIGWSATEAMAEERPFTGPLFVVVYYVFPRPKAHYRTGRFAGMLKPGAPHHKDTKPDLDKLTRAVFDGMKGIVYRDDGQVARCLEDKSYGEAPGVSVTVSCLRSERDLARPRTPPPTIEYTDLPRSR